MPKLKINPINIEKAKDARGIAKNITDVVDFQIATANDINRVIFELNELLPLFNKSFDDSKLKQRLSAVEKISKKIPAQYDDSAIKKQLSQIEALEHPAYNDSDLKSLIKEIAKANILLKDELEAVKKSNVSIQKEIRSNRKEAGFKIDVLEQKVNTLTEVK